MDYFTRSFIRSPPRHHFLAQPVADFAASILMTQFCGILSGLITLVGVTVLRPLQKYQFPLTLQITTPREITC